MLVSVVSAAMLYSRGKLISKSTGGEFACSQKQMETLKEADTVPAFLETVCEDFKGIAFEGDMLTFTGEKLYMAVKVIRARNTDPVVTMPTQVTKAAVYLPNRNCRKTRNML